MRPSRAFHRCWAADSTLLRDHPGSSASRFPVASAPLTKEMPTFIMTTRSFSVSKETKAPHTVPAQALLPAATPAALQVPTDEKGRLKRAVKYSVYEVPVPTELATRHLAADLVVTDDPGARPGDPVGAARTL